MTAVEWLIDKHFGGIDNVTPDFKYHIEQAKEMEKQQIIDAYADGRISVVSSKIISYEQYYNEKFNK